MARVLERSIHEAGNACYGRAVAFVGNSADILTQNHGEAIDSHDLVIRCNNGVPRGSSVYPSLGKRTDILTVGRLDLLRKALKFARPRWLWHFKLTQSGDREWPQILELAQQMPGEQVEVFRYPMDQELRVTEKVGSPPSTGMRVLDLLQQFAYPSKVSVFGCNWFGAAGGSAKSWWDPSKSPATAHVGRNEWATFQKMGFKKVSEGHWETRKWWRKRPPSWDDR